MVAVIAAACDRGPLTAPGSSTITVSAGAETLALGGSTQISAVVTESGGSPVQNGTSVRFTTTLGTLQPTEALTVSGIAVTTLSAGDVSGIAQVRAASGNAGSSGTTNLVEIRIGAEAAATLSLSSSSTTLPSNGGTVTLTAVVADLVGNRLRGLRVTFATTAGTLSSASPTTDDNGEVTTQLTTTRTATVTARAGAGDAARAGSVTVTVATANTISLSLNAASVTAGQPVTLTVTPTVGTGNSAPRVSVAWGDGSTDDLGVVASARNAVHVYNSAGTFSIVATATGDGETTTATIPVVVNPRLPINVNVSASGGPHTTTTAITFTATATEGGTAATISTYTWVVDSNTDSEDQTVVTTGNTFTRSFATTGPKVIRVTATTPDGRTGVGQTQVQVQ